MVFPGKRSPPDLLHNLGLNLVFSKQSEFLGLNAAPGGVYRSGGDLFHHPHVHSGFVRTLSQRKLSHVQVAGGLSNAGDC